MGENRLTSVSVPRKLLRRLRDRAGYKPLHVQIEEDQVDAIVLAEVQKRDPELVARARQAISA